MINILCPPSTLKLGRKGENEFRTIEFDVAPWLADYPNGSISVVYMRPDGVVYPPEVTTTNGVTSWVITSVDTAAAGAGYAEIRLIDGDVVGKSARINTMVYLAINGTEVAPPAPDWTVVAAQILSTIGNLDDLTTEDKSNLVAAINEAAQSGGGADLPDVTEADDGKVLKVIDGEWGVGDDGGIPDAPSDGKQYARKDGAWSEVEATGGGKFTVTVSDNDGTLTADKTFAEIKAAFDAGRYVVANYTPWQHEYRCVHVDNAEIGALFTVPTIIEDVGAIGALRCSADDEWSAFEKYLPTQLSQLTGDATHRTVTDAEKAAWDAKQDALIAGTGISIAADGKTISATAQDVLEVIYTKGAFDPQTLTYEYYCNKTLPAIISAISGGKIHVRYYETTNTVMPVYTELTCSYNDVSGILAIFSGIDRENNLITVTHSKPTPISSESITVTRTALAKVSDIPDLSNYAEKDDLQELQKTAITATVTIAVADWDSGTTAVKNVTGVTATNIVICDSSDPDVQCTAQGAGTLTFTATSTPSAEVSVKVVILP